MICGQNSERMKIAVLISTYNGHQYLDQQLESLQKQTVVNDITVFIRDDGSTDDTFQIIDDWRAKMNIVLYKESNVGPAMSFWNLFMNPEIHADYYAFCDQDDVWDEDKLEAAIYRLQGDTHFYACNCRIIDENGLITRELRRTEPPEINIKRLFVSGCTQGCSMVFTDDLRRHVVEMNLQCIPMHDVVLMLHALIYGDVYWDQTPHFSYRMHSNNVVAKANKSRLQRIKTTIWNWKNSSKNSMATVACEILIHEPDTAPSDKQFLELVADYKRHRYSVCRAYDGTDISKEAMRSFQIRVIMGLY